MLKLGKFNLMIVEKCVEFGFYLSDGIDRNNTILLPRKYIPPGIDKGSELNVFLYCDSEDRVIATTLKPKAQAGDLVALKVTDINRVGAFMDWGLEKDLFVPFREQLEKMELNRYYLVKIYVDKVTGRIVGSSRIGKFCNGDVRDLKINEKVKIRIWEKSQLGWKAVVNDKYIGLIHNSDLFQQVAVGDTLDAYVSAIREADNKVDVRLRPDGFKGVLDFKETILEALRDNNGFLPLTAKSSPEDIQKYFSFSKNVFKQLIGSLYKERQIVFTDDGMKLTDQENK